MAGEFSVILPTPGDSSHLRDALASALRSPAACEVLLIHDRRPGEAALDNALFADPRVRRIEPPAPGVSAARNAGIEASRGHYLAFLDDDDLWLPDHLDRALGMARRYASAALLGCDAWLFHDHTSDGSQRPPGDLSQLSRHSPGMREGVVSLRQLLLENPITTPSAVLVRDQLRSVDRFDTALDHMEDYDLWLRLARDRQLVFDPHPSVLVRKRRRSASRDWRRMAEGSLDVLQRFLAQGLPENTLSGSELRRRLGRLWHELAYACLIEDDLTTARRALRQSVVRMPLLPKNYIYLLASRLPRRSRQALFARGRRHLEQAGPLRAGTGR